MHISFVIEGVDGTGKTSIARQLTTCFHRNKMLKDFDVSLFREPGGTRIGEIVRNQILYPVDNSERIGHMTDKLCYVLSHSELMYTCKATKKAFNNSVIILDRYSPMSNMVYERYERKNEIGWMVEVYDRIREIYQPDIVFVLDPANEEAEQACMERSLAQRDNTNRDDLVSNKHKLDRMNGYRAFITNKVAHKNVVRIPIEATDSVEEIVLRIEDYVLQYYFGVGISTPRTQTNNACYVL